MTLQPPRILTLAALVAVARPAAADPIEVSSPHADALAAHRAEPRGPRIYPPAPLRAHRSLDKIVYGYLPYWVTDLSHLRLEDLSHLADFAIEMNSDGSLANLHGWPDSELADACHAAGVKIEVTFTLFSSSGLSTLLGSADNRATAITNIIDQLEAGGADGVSIDFEGVPAASREDLVSFFQELRAGLDARGHADAGISAAAPSVDWGDAWDLAAIADIIDVYFMMCYGYFWSGSAMAGPPGLFRTTAAWASAETRSILRTAADESHEAGEALRDKLVIGVPYYGREWTTVDDSYPTSVVAHQGAVTYAVARDRLADGATRTWDDGIRHPAIIEQSGGSWYQLWYDDEESLAYKYQLIREQELGGTGMWALGFDGAYPELWDLLEDYFSETVPLGAGSRDDPEVIDEFPFTDSGDTASEGYRYFDYYSCSPDTAEYGRELVYQVDLCQSGTLTATVADDAGVDVDLQLLDGLYESDCLARADVELAESIEPGRYYLVVDTYVNGSGVEQEGPFDLDADFEPDPDSPGCPADATCDAGECVCAGELSVCGDACVDLDRDPVHCGDCDTACPETQSCEQGSCIEPEPVPAGCGCRTGGPGGGAAGLLLLLLLGLARLGRARP